MSEHKTDRLSSFTRETCHRCESARANIELRQHKVVRVVHQYNTSVVGDGVSICTVSIETRDPGPERSSPSGSHYIPVLDIKGARATSNDSHARR